MKGGRNLLQKIGKWTHSQNLGANFNVTTPL